MKLTMLPSKILRQKSQVVNLPLSAPNKTLIKAMQTYIFNSLEATNQLRPGVGLAACQAGFNLNIFFVHIPLGNDAYLTDTVINPVLKAESATYAALKDGEGCLSVLENHPQTKGYVWRKWKVVIEAFSLAEKRLKTFKLTGYPAIVFQHELDHLHGKLFFERIQADQPWKKTDQLILI